MSEFKGTKGSWCFNEVDFSVTTRGDYKNPTEICHVMDNNPYDGVYEEDVANGHIIAAAPDLLEALQFVRPWLPTHDAEALHMVERAINKALGQ